MSKLESRTEIFIPKSLSYNKIIAMKTKWSVGISLFLFWSLVTAIVTAGLITHQKKIDQNPPVATANSTLVLDNNEISKHNSRTDCWLIISNKVYNVTSFLNAHPGGAGVIALFCGKEATLAFSTKDLVPGRNHSSTAYSLLANYYIGDLNQTINTQAVQNAQNQVVPPGFQGNDD